MLKIIFNAKKQGSRLSNLEPLSLGGNDFAFQFSDIADKFTGFRVEFETGQRPKRWSVYEK